MTVRKDLDALVGEVELALVLAKGGVAEDEVARIGRDAFDSGADNLQFWMNQRSPGDEEIRQAQTSRRLRDVGEALLKVSSVRRRERMNNYLGGQVRFATNHGQRIRGKVSGEPVVLQ